MMRYLMICALLLMTLPAFAQTSRYAFDSGTYTNAVAPYTTSMRITGAFVTAEPLPPNASGLQIGPRSAVPLVTAYSFFDGIHTYTESNSIEFGPNPALFRVWTDADGNIVNWYIALYSPVSAVGGEDIFAIQLYGTEASVINGECSSTPCDSVSIAFDTPRGSVQPGGTWTRFIARPVPATSPLSIAGALALMLMALGVSRRRKWVR